MFARGWTALQSNLRSMMIPLLILDLIDTRYRENDRFRDRDLIRVTQCQMPSKFSDADLLHNIRVSKLLMFLT